MEMTQGIVVLDGADCSGKTTLAKWFIENCGARYLHLGIYKDLFSHQLASYRLAERWASRGELVIIDRHWVSELAYGDSLRDGAQNPVSLIFFDRLFLRSAALNILCVPVDIDEHLSRFKQHKEQRYEMFDLEAVHKVIRYYRWLAGNLDEKELSRSVTNYAAVLREAVVNRPDYRVYDLEADGKDVAGYCRFMLEYLGLMRDQQYIAGLDEKTPNFAGFTEMAKILMVGERAGNKDQRGKIRYPFCSRDDQLSSALWLNRALDNLNISEHELCWVNAFDESWTETSTELLELLDEKNYKWEKIVALGQTAATHLSRCGLKEDKDFVKIPHPQWARRFRYRDHQWYTQILGEAMGIKE